METFWKHGKVCVSQGFIVSMEERRSLLQIHTTELELTISMNSSIITCEST